MNDSQGKSQNISMGTLEWIKSDDFVDRYSELLNINITDRSVILDFGSTDYSKRTHEGIDDLHVNMHTRIRVSIEHFHAIAKLFDDMISNMGGK